MARTLTKPEGLDPREGALLDVTRLALRGDTRSLRQRMRNLLRGGADPVLTEPARLYLSQLLTDADPAPPMRTANRVPPSPLDGLPRDDQTATPLVAAEWPEPSNPPVLPDAIHRRLDRIVREHELRHLLAESGLTPTERIMLTGRPGTGKTMTALHLAARLGLPLLRAEPSVVITSLLGQSARNVTKMFSFAAQQPCVLLLDELDAYARRRDDEFDIAEPKRLVNTLLLEIDRWPSCSVLIAATNHPKLLDHAVTRRFDAVLPLPAPNHAARLRIITAVLAGAGWAIDERLLEIVAMSTEGLSGSDLETDTRDALRAAILGESGLEHALADRFIRGRLAGRSARARKVREDLVLFAQEALGMTQRDIAELLDVSHVTVGNILRAHRGK